MNVESIYSTLSVILAVATIVLEMKCLQKDMDKGLYLSITCFFAAVVNVSYLASVLLHQYFAVSVFSSVYFAAIDLMLYFLLRFTHRFVNYELERIQRMELMAARIYMGFDILVFAVNPFREIAVHYVDTGMGFAQFRYEMSPLFVAHLVFTYLLVAVALYHLVRKVRRVPSVYRLQYQYAVGGIIAIILLNAVFLYLPNGSVLHNLDISVLLYSVTAFFVYWSCYGYSQNRMKNEFRSWILTNIDQGIALFDFEDHLIQSNAKLGQMFPELSNEKHTTLESFRRQCGISSRGAVTQEDESFFCYSSSDTEKKNPLQCDYRSLKSKNGEMVGRLYVFTDPHLKQDLLTGFVSWDYLRQSFEGIHVLEEPFTVAVCDINGLRAINEQMGKNVGDQAIVRLAGLMRKHFGTPYYNREPMLARGQEAGLIAICYGVGEAQTQATLEEIKKAYNADQSLGCSLDFQSAVCSVDRDGVSIPEAVETAKKAMRVKKLLDSNAARSASLTSLIQALQESDGDTEAHVQRTQTMGARLGRYIGLTDAQQSDLSLLCLLHDIGKIGIPLEILNKPGKLTEEEFAAIRTHVEKGYQIAGSSRELAGIADMIRHHHERWDGQGYPDGLKGEEIPLLSRVIAIVDAYDAMTNDRIYQRAISRAQAIAKLEYSAGSQFDPAVTAAFVKMLREQEQVGAEPVKSGRKPQPAQMENAGEDTSPVRRVQAVSYARYLLDEQDRILTAEGAFEVITGYSPGELETHPLHQVDLILPEDREEYIQRISRQLWQNQRAFCEHRIRRKDGSVRYVFCYGRRYYDSVERAGRSEIIMADSMDTHVMKTMAEEHELRI